jgi:hypothetical protein
MTRKKKRHSSDSRPKFRKLYPRVRVTYNPRVGEWFVTLHRGPVSVGKYVGSERTLEQAQEIAQREAAHARDLQRALRRGKP